MDVLTAPARMVDAIGADLLLTRAITANNIGVASSKSDDAAIKTNTAALRNPVSPTAYGALGIAIPFFSTNPTRGSVS